MSQNFIVRITEEQMTFQPVESWMYPLAEGEDGHGCTAINNKRCQVLFADSHQAICYDYKYELFGLSVPRTGYLCERKFEAVKRSMAMITRKELRLNPFENKESKTNGALLRMLFKEFRVIGGSYDLKDEVGLFSYSNSKTQRAQIESGKVIDLLLAHL